MYKICTIGAGTAQASMLHSLQSLPATHLTAIVCTTDNGGSSAAVRDALHIPSPGDVRNCINHLTIDDNSLLSQLLNYRFSEGELKGVHLGNLIIGAASRITGSYEQGLSQLQQELQMSHTVLPVSTTSSQIGAILEDGSNVVGEWHIIKRDNKSPLTSIYLDPPAKASPQVVQAIQDADMIIICPGVLCTALGSVLLHEGLSDAIRDSSAPLIHFGNLFTKPNQTEGRSMSRHVTFLEELAGRRLDYLIVNDRPNEFVVDYYAQKGYDLVEIDTDNISSETTLITGTYIMDTQAQQVDSLERVKTSKQHISPHLIRSDGEAVKKVVSEIKNGHI